MAHSRVGRELDTTEHLNISLPRLCRRVDVVKTDSEDVPCCWILMLVSAFPRHERANSLKLSFSRTFVSPS
jgi:hypothetical protein